MFTLKCMVVVFAFGSAIRLMANCSEYNKIYRLSKNAEIASDLCVVLCMICTVGVLVTGIEEFILYPLMALDFLISVSCWLVDLLFLRGE